MCPQNKLLNRKVKEDRNDYNYTVVMLFAALACCINPLTKTGKSLDPLSKIALLLQLLEEQFHVCPSHASAYQPC
jgi:hypothetical protein